MLQVQRDHSQPVDCASVLGVLTKNLSAERLGFL
jgi:hypothetical protein